MNDNEAREREIATEVQALYERVTNSRCQIDIFARILPDRLELEFVDEYEKPHISFDLLSELSEHFSTRLIDVRDGLVSPGCETCDYGSSYGVIVSLRAWS